MAQKFYAIAKSDNSFIVNAGSVEELNAKIDEIRRNHPDYYHRHITPGFFIVQAGSLKEAKAGKKHISFDLPLFRESM